MLQVLLPSLWESAILRFLTPVVSLIHLEDRPRLGILDVISELKDQAKVRVMMLTGDHKSSAWRVANAVGINEVYCSLKPEDKLNHVKRISRDTRGGLIIAGEGINDAPALAASTVGIVLAHCATATATPVADVLLFQDNLGVPFSIAKVLLHEGGSLLVCLNSIRALNDPSWSWGQDLRNLICKLRSKLGLLRHNSTSSIIQTAPL